MKLNKPISTAIASLETTNSVQTLGRRHPSEMLCRRPEEIRQQGRLSLKIALRHTRHAQFSHRKTASVAAPRREIDPFSRPD